MVRFRTEISGNRIHNQVIVKERYAGELRYRLGNRVLSGGRRSEYEDQLHTIEYPAGAPAIKARTAMLGRCGGKRVGANVRNGPHLRLVMCEAVVRIRPYCGRCRTGTTRPEIILCSQRQKHRRPGISRRTITWMSENWQVRDRLSTYHCPHGSENDGQRDETIISWRYCCGRSSSVGHRPRRGRNFAGDSGWCAHYHRTHTYHYMHAAL